MTRTGKIARLPLSIRTQLNLRLQDGEIGRKLVDWLNSLPQIRAILNRDFGGRLISEQNLTEWKQGGFIEWIEHNAHLDEIREMVQNAGELTQAAGGAISDSLAASLTLRYTAALNEWDGQETEAFQKKLKALHQACADIATLRRGDHSAARLDIEKQSFQRGREKSEEETFDYFRHWAAIPEVRDILIDASLEDQARIQHLREIFGFTSGKPTPRPVLPPANPAKPK